MEISHHKALVESTNRNLAHAILNAARIKSAEPTYPAPENDGIVRVPGISRPGGINSLIAPPSGERAFELKTRTEACDRGWPQDRHLAIERKRKIPLVGDYIANRLHKRMTTGVLRRREEAQQARF